MRPKELVKSPLIYLLDKPRYIELDAEGLWMDYLTAKKRPKGRRMEKIR